MVDAGGRPLMPCHPARARLLIKKGKALPKRNKLGIFYIQLTYEAELANQVLVLGVDPGSKFEGFSVVGTERSVLNVMSEAVTHVKGAVRQRREMRRARRYRKTRRRPERSANRRKGDSFLPPSTRARWEAKLRVIRQLVKILPVSDVAVEDVRAGTRKGERRWNEGFSPVQAGKERFYRGLRELGFEPILRRGYETRALRERFGLTKSRDKGERSFWSHCVDAWVLAASVSGARKPDDTGLYYLAPMRFHRRQLHRLEPEKGGERRPYGGTRSMGFKRGTLVRHPSWGLCYVGGHLDGRLSLHSLKTGRRLTQDAKSEDCLALTGISWRSYYVSGGRVN
ncbi:MAG: RRXRR domain-containing protein [Moorellales bacterium]